MSGRLCLFSKRQKIETDKEQEREKEWIRNIREF